MAFIQGAVNISNKKNRTLGFIDMNRFLKNRNRFFGKTPSKTEAASKTEFFTLRYKRSSEERKPKGTLGFLPYKASVFYPSV